MLSSERFSIVPKHAHLSFQSSSGKPPWYLLVYMLILSRKSKHMMSKIKPLYLVAIDQVDAQHHGTGVHIISLCVWLEIFEFEFVPYIWEIDWTVEFYECS